jgi:hypothetical protein
MANLNRYGVWGLADLSAQRVSTVGVPRITRELQAVAMEYSRTAAAMLAEWVQPVTVAKERVLLPGSGTLQPLDEYGNPLPVKPSGGYDVGYPIQGGGTAWGDNRVTRALMTVADVERNTLDAIVRDKDWLQRHILAALFTNTSWTFLDEVPQGESGGAGTVSVMPLANGDTVIYARKGGSASTDTHYLAQAAGIADATNPYPTIRAELIEHPSNGNGSSTAYIATNLVAATQALATFNPVGRDNVRYGSGVTLYEGSEFEGIGVGDRVIGEVGGMRIVEWSTLPDNYIVAKMDNVAPVAMRQYDAPELQGLFPEIHSPDGNRIETRWLRFAGFGVRERVGAVVMRTGNGSYAIPSGYAAP